MSLATCICADIGGSFIKFGLSSQAGAVMLIDQCPNPAHSWGDFVGALQQLIATHHASIAPDAPLAISTTGVVNSRSDTILAGNIPAFNGHKVTAELTDALKRPVVIANDADCFTLAESRLGKAHGCTIVLGAILGTGVGGGLVIDGNIIEGRGGITAEWGHGPITKTLVSSLSGEELTLPRLACGCGQVGCLDTYGGARGLERLHQWRHNVALSSREIMQQWHEKAPQALETLHLWLQIVSEPLAFTINILGVDKVVVGGGLASEEELIAQLDNAVRQLILTPTAEKLIEPGQFYHQGGLVGASFLTR